jgi:hypothetical protein
LALAQSSAFVAKQRNYQVPRSNIHYLTKAEIVFRTKFDDSEFTPELKFQIRISKLLGTAFAFSITGIVGVGSLIAFVLGVKAWRLIRHSSGPVNGRLMAWWCIGVGGLGTSFWLPGTITMLLKLLR